MVRTSLALAAALATIGLAPPAHATGLPGRLTRLQAPPEPSDPPPRGIGMLASGIPMTVVGFGMIVSGGVFLGFYNPCGVGCDNDTGSFFRPLGLGVLLPGLVVFGGGVALTVLGVGRRRSFLEWQASHVARVQPWTGRSALGTQTFGLAWRF